MCIPNITSNYKLKHYLELCIEKTCTLLCHWVTGIASCLYKPAVAIQREVLPWGRKPNWSNYGSMPVKSERCVDAPCSAGSRVQPSSGYRRWIPTNDRTRSWHQRCLRRWQMPSHESPECYHYPHTYTIMLQTAVIPRAGQLQSHSWQQNKLFSYIERL